MTGLREILDLNEPKKVSAAPDRVRLSILGDRSQVDVSLPQDVPIALLMPDLMRLVRSPEATATDVSESALSNGANRIVWSLTRLSRQAPLELTNTLRQADIGD